VTRSTLTSTVFQTLGASLLVSGAQSAFTNTLLRQLPKDAPLVSPAAVVAAGATGLRDTFPEHEIPNILVSYMAALRATYIISITTAGMAAVVAIFIPWRSIKGKATVGVA
jgi:hypothetical protein